MSSTIKIYRLLLNRFGPQGWWPTTAIGEFAPKYYPDGKAILSESEKFEICVGAILTQNTAWSNVTKALTQLHQARLMSPRKIAKVPFAKLAKFIRSSGYFRQKAKKLKILASYLLKNYSGKVNLLFKKPMEEIRGELLELYGMGPETVDSILLYAGEMPIFVVDAYTRRIGNRVGLFQSEDYAKVQSYFEKNLERSVPLFNEYHALLVALGKDFCRTKPLCDSCPLNKICRFARSAE